MNLITQYIMNNKDEIKISRFFPVLDRMINSVEV